LFRAMLVFTLSNARHILPAYALETRAMATLFFHIIFRRCRFINIFVISHAVRLFRHFHYALVSSSAPAAVLLRLLEMRREDTPSSSTVSPPPLT
jgi:hypothetical protein